MHALKIHQEFWIWDRTRKGNDCSSIAFEEKVGNLHESFGWYPRANLIVIDRPRGLCMQLNSSLLDVMKSNLRAEELKGRRILTKIGNRTGALSRMTLESSADDRGLMLRVDSRQVHIGATGRSLACTSRCISRQAVDLVFTTPHGSAYNMKYALHHVAAWQALMKYWRGDRLGRWARTTDHVGQYSLLMGVTILQEYYGNT